MSELDEILKLACKKEIEGGFYDYKINNIPVFHYLKRYYRRSLINQANGNDSNYGKENRVSFWNHVKMLFCYDEYEWKSLKQILRLCFSSMHYDNFIFAFMRKELVNGMYVDKFTDPLIDNSNIKQSFIIFERRFQGRHAVPRCHSEKIIYDDVLWKMAKTRAFFWGPVFNLMHKRVIDEIEKQIDKYYPGIYHTRSFTAYFIHFNYLYTKLYYRLFRKLKIKRLIAPSRADFLQLIPAAKLNKIEVIELQHGVSYGESMTYSGYRDELFIPDRFFSFGKLHLPTVYGIDEDKIQEIGWAFSAYLESQSMENLADNEVLVISEPCASNRILRSIVELAEKNPSVIFHFRPHPNEKLSQEQRDVVNSVSNIILDDNQINIMFTIMRFQHVIGENSTALYEALSLGKKVGNLYMNGLTPKYIQEDDKNCFWAIYDDISFKTFLKESKELKQSKSIYSTFNPDKVNSVIV